MPKNWGRRKEATIGSVKTVVGASHAVPVTSGPRRDRRGHPHVRQNHAPTRLFVTTWPLAIYPNGKGKTGITSVVLGRTLPIKCETAWLLQSKILRVMTELEEAYLLREKIRLKY